MDKKSILTGAEEFMQLAAEIRFAVCNGLYKEPRYSDRVRRLGSFITELASDEDARLRNLSEIIRRLFAGILVTNAELDAKIGKDNAEFMRIMEEVT